MFLYIFRIVKNTTDVIIDTMFQSTVAWPDEVADFPHLFYGQGGYPSVCGCVDGTVIKIDAPSDFEGN